MMSLSQPPCRVSTANCMLLGQLHRPCHGSRRSHPYTRRNNRHYDQNEKQGTHKTRSQKFEEGRNLNRHQGSDEFSQVNFEIQQVREAVQAETADLGGLRAATRNSGYKLDKRHIQGGQSVNQLEKLHECTGKKGPQEENRSLLQALEHHRLQQQADFECYERAKQQHLSQQKTKLEQNVNEQQNQELLALRKGRKRSVAVSQGSLPPFQHQHQLFTSQAVPGFAMSSENNASYHDNDPDVKMADAF